MFEKKDDLFCDIRIFYLICECKLKFMKCKYKTLLSEGYERGYGLHVKYVNERYGLFNQEGRMLLPCAYEKIEHFDDDGYAWVCHDGRWGMTDTRGRLQIQPRFLQKGTFVDGICWVQRADGAWGRINVNGDIITPFVFAGHHPVFAVLVFKQGKFFGAINAQGQIVLPCEYTSIEEVELWETEGSCSYGRSLTNYKIALASKGEDKWLLDRQGQIRYEEPFCEIYCEALCCLPSVYSHIYEYCFYDDQMFFAKRKDPDLPFDSHTNQLIGIFDVKKDDFFLPCIYEDIAHKAIGNPWFDRTEGHFNVARRDGKDVILDHTGRETMPLEYDKIEFGRLDEGEYLIPAYKNGLWGYINVYGTLKISCRFMWAGQFYKGVAPVQYASYIGNTRLEDYTEKRMEVRFINHHGTEVDPPDDYPYTIYKW